MGNRGGAITRLSGYPLTHLIISREYPPAPYPVGGIGTYIKNMSRLLAEAGETVHVVAQRWDGASEKITESYDGRLIVHRVALDEPVSTAVNSGSGDARLLSQLATSNCPSQLFAWQAAQYAEALIRTEPIDLVEGQEWEAPLYYLQLRRALGLGPRHEPPCLVHLHSPSQFIFEHNAWDQTLTDFLPLSRFEEYTIKSADALLCPSGYLADGVTERFQLNERRIDVIPYPRGDTPKIERGPEVWARDAILYVGRLELRKGVVEFVDAAVKVAAWHATVSFDFLGSDTSLTGGIGSSVLEYLQSRIPRSMRARFRFHGVQSQPGLMHFLSQVSIAVVPSRWENLPFTCIEAMSTGLPILASPNGGMSELVEDQKSGWIASNQTALGLEAALQRALATPNLRRKAMGDEAAARVRLICDNQTILTRQLSLRDEIVRIKKLHSRSSPTEGMPRSEAGRRGVGVLITCLERSVNLAECLDSVALQSVASPVVLVIAAEFRSETKSLIEDGELARAGKLTTIYTGAASPDAARVLGLNELLGVTPELRAIVQISQDARLEACCTAVCESVFDLQPRLGLCSSWILCEERPPYLDTGPVLLASRERPDLPLWSAIRVQVLLAAKTQATNQELSSDAICDALAYGGWAAMTYPATLVSLHACNDRSNRKPPRRYSVMALAQSGSARSAMRWVLTAPWPDNIKWICKSLSQPRRLARWVLWQTRRRSA